MAEIGHRISRRKQAKRKPPLAGKKDSEHSINEQDSVPICGGWRVCAPQAPHDPYDPSKKTRTQPIFSVQLTILGLLKDRDRKDYDHGRCVRKSVLWNKNPSILSGYFQGKEGS